jgi:phosphoglycerate dehydrogenase-like enzyme
MSLRSLAPVWLIGVCLFSPGWLFAQKKLVAIDVAPGLVAALQKAAGPQDKVVLTDANSAAREIADADALIAFRANADLIRAAKKLKWIQVPYAGVEQWLAVPEVKDSPIELTNCNIIPGPNIADHAFAMLLALTRGLVKTIPAQARQEWNRAEMGRIELQGRTALIVGVGGIGMQIAQRAKGFGMRVIGVDPKDMPMTMLVDEWAPPDRLDAVLPQADVVFVSAPDTAQSRGMFNRERFQSMKQGAYFIAVSRGKLYSPAALVEALDSRRLAGAGLDVTDPEPLPKEHPLWKFDNVVITPHIATQSDRMAERTEALIVDNWKRFLAGEPLRHKVDKQKGY